MKNLQNFSQSLKRLRKNKNVTQLEVSELLNVTERHYQKIEYGEVNIPMIMLITLADYFDVTLDELVGRVDYGGKK